MLVDLLDLRSAFGHGREKFVEENLEGIRAGLWGKGESEGGALNACEWCRCVSE